jgi:hypothetical protein
MKRILLVVLSVGLISVAFSVSSQSAKKPANATGSPVTTGLGGGAGGAYGPGSETQSAIKQQEKDEQGKQKPADPDANKSLFERNTEAIRRAEQRGNVSNSAK